MRVTLKRIIRDEKGKVLILTLVLLVVGGLILAPLLGLMTTGLASGQVYEKKAAELYAADAGVENAIWHLQQGGHPDDVLTLTLNGRDVSVSIVRRDDLRTACHEPAIYDITSTATTTGGSSTTVMAQVTNIYVYVETGLLNQGEIIGGDVYAPGDLFLDSDAEIHGNTIVVGDLTLNECSLVGGVVCVGGDLTLNEGAQIQSDIFVGGSLLMMGGVDGSWVDGQVYIRGTELRSGEDGPYQVKMTGKAEIYKDLWAGNQTAGTVQVDKNASVLGDVHVRYEEVVDASGQVGQIYEDYYDHYCPLGYGRPEIRLWLIV